MVLSIGVDTRNSAWKTCLMENGQALELHSYQDYAACLAYLESTCAFYPEPIIGLVTDFDTPLTTAHTLADKYLLDVIQEEKPESPVLEDTVDFLIAIGSKNITSFILPSVVYLPTIPPHRKLHRAAMGTSDRVCLVATMLYRMREQSAAWSEMNLLLLSVEKDSKSIVVVNEGQLVDGMSNRTGNYHLFLNELDQFDDTLWEQAFGEGLVQDLAGLLALHHFEDIVVTGQQRELAIEKLSDNYQLYEFPQVNPDQEGFEVAIGAAIIAEGLVSQGLASEVVAQLQIRASARLSRSLTTA